VALLLIGIQSLSAQLDRLPSRRELDSLAHPKLSTTANRGIAAQRATIELGKIVDAQSIRAEFELRNNTTKSVAITQLRSTCSCLKIVTRPTTLLAGQSITLEVEFNPKGRSGKFSQEVLVYTSLDGSYPTERLTLCGTIESSSRFPHLANRIGSLYLSRRSVCLNNITPGTTRSESISVANGGEQSLRLWAKPLVDGLKFSLSPATLQPGQEGEIVISYTATEEPTRELETLLIIEGCEGRPTERTIKVTIMK
jgi:hypothetical protein